jgi:ribonuclease E
MEPEGERSAPAVPEPEREPEPSYRSEETTSSYPRETFEEPAREVRSPEPAPAEREPEPYRGYDVPVHVAPEPQASPETHTADDHAADPASPARKGWWQRRFGNG